ncbi:hypothetical protein HJC23_006888 [Cyclotella cryptica]|uniref:Carbohydrate kinase PfkB domain-containing protein n=1 Tax=Cyclotella cryptica TaxID=29204 RepID=A0ABD3QIQ9_9STRA|eukprot:CCRYP_006712-RA/>CCRYP_006712-RA protein AED:0.17 eAED:0.17 QI:0/-1/0/1/-1/1/1/0/477
MSANRRSIGIVSHKKVHLALWPCLILQGAHSFSVVTSVHLNQISSLSLARPNQLHHPGRFPPLFSIDSTNGPLHEIDSDRSRRIVVVGKIIIDNYGDPSKRAKKDSAPSALTVGGGGPQAAWGAAAALAVRSHFFRSESVQTSKGSNRPITSLPPRQPVTFIAPIGLQNWTPQHAAALENLLIPVIDVPPVLISSVDHITPTINIWHDENETVQWYPVDGSFDARGADGLWRNRPSATDILATLKNDVPNSLSESDSIVLHCIVESGENPTGKGEDALFLHDLELLSKITVLGIEPIVFPDGDTQRVSQENGKSVASLIENVQQSLAAQNNPDHTLLVVTPDRACFDSAFAKDGTDNNNTWLTQSWISTEIVVRNGAHGSFIKDQQEFPSATLQTPNKKPLNPTGAGNAYSAAYVACRGTGSTSKEAAVLATAVGAVVCEYEHLPGWSWEVLERVAEAAREVERKLSDEMSRFSSKL